MLLEILADSLAEFQTGDVGHGPVGDHQGRFVLGEQIEGFAAVFCENYVVIVVGRVCSTSLR